MNTVNTGPSALALTTPEQTPAIHRPLVHLALGDLELRADASMLAAWALDPLASMLASNVFLATAVRGAALTFYPAIRKLMRQVKPEYPQPDMPRGADPAIYLATYLLTVAQCYVLEWRWIFDYSERADGALEITGARADTRMQASDHATDGTDGPLGTPVDTTDAGPAPRGA